MAEQTPQPRNIFECINQNIVDLSYDVVSIQTKVDEINTKLDSILSALYPSESANKIEVEPNADGAAIINE